MDGISAVRLAQKAVRADRPGPAPHRDGTDLAVIASLYVATVALFRLAFTVFTAERVTGLFLSFAAAIWLAYRGERRRERPVTPRASVAA